MISVYTTRLLWFNCNKIVQYQSTRCVYLPVELIWIWSCICRQIMLSMFEFMTDRGEGKSHFTLLASSTKLLSAALINQQRNLQLNGSGHISRPCCIDFFSSLFTCSLRYSKSSVQTSNDINCSRVASKDEPVYVAE